MSDTGNPGRRHFLAGAMSVGAATIFARTTLAETPHAEHSPAKGAGALAGAIDTKPKNGALEQPALPYAQNALAPHISADTVALHYGKHHHTYYEKVNTAIQNTPRADKSLAQIVQDTAKKPADSKLFNSAAQAWNHDFYWQSMKAGGGGAPPAAVAARIQRDFGSYDNFKQQFSQLATEHFSNGWVWLVLDPGKNKLAIVETHDADTPIVHGQKPLLVTDVWEHAYYLDYKNVRKDYVTAFVDHLINWDFVAANLA